MLFGFLVSYTEFFTERFFFFFLKLYPGGFFCFCFCFLLLLLGFFGPLDSSCILFSCSCLVYTLHHFSAPFLPLGPNILESVNRPLIDLHPSPAPAVITMPWETTLRSPHMPMTLGGPICQDEKLAQKKYNKTVIEWVANCCANI